MLGCGESSPLPPLTESGGGHLPSLVGIFCIISVEKTTPGNRFSHVKLQPATSVPATSADGCEHGAFRRFYEGTAASLRRYLARMLGSHETAQDVAQDAYVRVHAAMGRTAIERPQAYLYITARRLALDELRKRRADPLNMRYAEALEEVLAEGPGVEQIVMARQELAVLLQDIDTLPPGLPPGVLAGPHAKPHPRADRDSAGHQRRHGGKASHAGVAAAP